MNKADPLIAAFRQLGAGKVAPRTAVHTVPVAKDGKDKAEHFREQLRSIAQGANSGLQVDQDGTEAAAVQGAEAPLHTAELAGEIKTRPKGRSEQLKEKSTHQGAMGVESLPMDWRGPEAALSAVISRLDQAQAPAVRDEGIPTRTANGQARIGQKEMSLQPDPSMELPTMGDLPEQRFALSVDAAETRAASTVKVVVREQETHFEPIQQVSVLQKIVDRMVADLPAAPAPVGVNVTDAMQPDMVRGVDKPVRILTLQLDPPDLGAVTVRMRLAGDAVEVRLTADKYETTQILQKERGTLSDAMQSAGYKFDIASIDHSRAGDANSNPGQQQGQSEHRQSQQSHAGSQFDSGSSGRSSSDAQGGTRQNRQGHDQLTEPMERQQDKKSAVDRNGGAVYL